MGGCKVRGRMSVVRCRLPWLSRSVAGTGPGVGSQQPQHVSERARVSIQIQRIPTVAKAHISLHSGADAIAGHGVIVRAIPDRRSATHQANMNSDKWRRTW